MGFRLNLAASYLRAGRLVEALKLNDEVSTHFRKVLGPRHPDTLSAMNNLAISAYQVGRRDQALALIEELVPLRREVNGPEHPDTIGAMGILAAFYSDSGRWDEALQLHEEVLTLLRKVLGPEHRATLNALDNLVMSYQNAGRPNEALSQLEQLLPLSRKVFGAKHPVTLRAMNDVMLYYFDAGRRDEAIQLTNELLALRADDPGLHNTAAWQLATVPDEDERYPQAKQAVEWARRANELAPNNGDLLNTLGVALYRAGQWQESIDTLQKSIEHGSDTPSNWLFIAMAHWHVDQKDKAKEWYDKSLAWQTANEPEAKADTELQGFFAEAAKLMTADA